MSRFRRLWRRAVVPTSSDDALVNEHAASGGGNGGGGGNNAKNARRRNTATTSEIGDEAERKLRANDREFNAQFGYAVSANCVRGRQIICILVQLLQGNYIKTSKYNLITFLPKNLFEQFQRLANFYFLVLMVLQLIPIISSIAWYSTAIPLAFVLIVSAIKEGYDDFVSANARF